MYVINSISVLSIHGFSCCHYSRPR